MAEVIRLKRASAPSLQRHMHRGTNKEGMYENIWGESNGNRIYMCDRASRNKQSKKKIW